MDNKWDDEQIFNKKWDYNGEQMPMVLAGKKYSMNFNSAFVKACNINVLDNFFASFSYSSRNNALIFSVMKDNPNKINYKFSFRTKYSVKLSIGRLVSYFDLKIEEGKKLSTYIGKY